MQVRRELALFVFQRRPPGRRCSFSSADPGVNSAAVIELIVPTRSSALTQTAWHRLFETAESY